MKKSEIQKSIVCHLITGAVTFFVCAFMPIFVFCADQYATDRTVDIPSLSIWTWICLMVAVLVSVSCCALTIIVTGVRSVVHFSRWIPAILVYPLTATLLVEFNPHNLVASPKWLYGVSGFFAFAFILYWALYLYVYRSMPSVKAAENKASIALLQ